MSDVVLITGASVGVGLELARLLRSTDRRLVLTARPASLHRFASVGFQDTDRVWVRPLDVTARESQEALIGEIEARWGGVDVLVNNAGVSWRSVVEHVAEPERLEQMDVNFRSPMSLTVRCLPHMRAQRRGRIIAVSSVGGMMAMPTMAVYSASKFALEGAYEALWYEVRPWNIGVTLVEPGFINSDGFEKVRFTDLARSSLTDDNDPYHQHYRHMESFVGTLMRTFGQSPKHVAKRVVRAIERRSPPLRMAGTFDARIFQLARRLLPRRIYHELLYRGLPGIRSWGAGQPRPVAQGEQVDEGPARV
ncbi:MAG: SDR family NAD(P)-dependent oxidoreductase [Myxococcota bacterium]